MFVKINNICRGFYLFDGFVVGKFDIPYQTIRHADNLS